MRERILLFTFFVTLVNLCNAQITAYSAINSSMNFGSQCVDLHFTNPEIIGHQKNVEIQYFLTENDALNEISALNRFYEPLSNPQTIYARVSSVLSEDFAVSEVIVTKDTSFPPAGISPCEYTLCDVNDDGMEIVYLNNLKCAHNANVFDAQFCSSSTHEIETTFYLSENDASSEINPISEAYSITGTTTIFTKLKNTITSQSYIDGYITIHLKVCEEDFDNDGIPDGREDPNNNLVNDDDTDKDGIENRKDDDDDGDGILTIDEDYNNNGDPTDDDTNKNGIPDYLEFDITLSTIKVSSSSFGVYLDPVSPFLIITSKNLKRVELLNPLGQIIFTANDASKIDVSNVSPGLFFVRTQDANGAFNVKKILKK